MHLSKEEYKRLDQLIRLKATGTPQELAEKFNLSKRTMQRIIEIMQEVGCPICYSRLRRSYCYEYPGRLIIKFEPLDNSELNKINGGFLEKLFSMPNSGIENNYVCNEEQINSFSVFPTPNFKVGFKFFKNGKNNRIKVSETFKRRNERNSRWCLVEFQPV